MTLAVKIILITMAALVAGGITYSSIANNGKIKKIKANPKQSTAKVYEKYIPKVSSTGVTSVTYQSRYKYQFSVDGKMYEGLTDRYFFQIENGDAIMNQTFPVIYDEKNPDNSFLLILQRDFSEFGLTQPDSLKHYEQVLK